MTMNTALLPRRPGILAGLALRGGLTLASWGLERAAARTDRDRLARRLAVRAAAEAAVAERDATFRSSAYFGLM